MDLWFFLRSGQLIKYVLEEFLVTKRTVNSRIPNLKICSYKSPIIGSEGFVFLDKIYHGSNIPFKVVRGTNSRFLPLILPLTVFLLRSG